MGEITLNDLQGTWLGNEYNLIIGHQQNPTFARLVNNEKNTIIETSNLQISPLTEENTRMLIFDEGYSIEIWGWYTTEMTIIINSARYDIALRP